MWHSELISRLSPFSTAFFLKGLISHNQISHPQINCLAKVGSWGSGCKNMSIGWSAVLHVQLFNLCLHFWCLGHSKAVRDICFNNTGTQFLSAAYDRYLKLWDSETGEMQILTLTWKTSICCSVQMSHWVFLSLQASASHTSPTGRSRTASSSTLMRTNRISLWRECRIRRLFR